MTEAEAALAIQNRRDGYLRQADEADESAMMYESAACADGVGHILRGKALEFCAEHLARGKRYRRMAEALTIALQYLPAMEMAGE